jgi:serine/threonine-protein kinase
MLGSRWILGGLLGQSEGAEVYEGEEAQQRRFAAIKFFDPAFAAEPAWSEHAELTRRVSELAGDSIARAYDIGLEPAYRRPYVASERVTFPTLARSVSARGPLSLRAVAHALETLARGLDTAHAAGIVHGGLKPQNVFVAFDNPRWVRITDFGVARLRAASGRGPASVLGWSAPESSKGESSAASDRYTLGLLCFFAATGLSWFSALKAFDAPASEQQRGARRASERAGSQGAELDPSFDAWFERALAPDPAARFATATEMARAFLDVFAGGPTAGMPARNLDAATAATAATLPLPRTSSAPPPAVLPSVPAPGPSVPPPGMAPRSASVPPPYASVPPEPSSGPPAMSDMPPRPFSGWATWFWLIGGGIVLGLMLGAWWLRTH